MRVSIDQISLQMNSKSDENNKGYNKFNKVFPCLLMF